VYMVTLVVQCVGLHCTTPQVSPRTPATCIAATTPELIVGILNSAFFKFLNIQ